MKLKREYKVGTPIRFKWYYNNDQYISPNSQFIVKEGIVDSNTFLNDVIIYCEKDNAWYSIPAENIVF